MLRIDPTQIATKDLHQYMLSAVAPRPIAFVSTISTDGVPNLAPYSFFNAFSSNPPIVILDEATASVDRETERRLQLAQEKLINGRTALIVAHRLSTIEKCDRIILVADGRVLEEGSHHELVAKNGRYAALVEMQRTEG
jgi:ABC-type uncharacterized transport system ATPase subunit